MEEIKELEDKIKIYNYDNVKNIDKLLAYTKIHNENEFSYAILDRDLIFGRFHLMTGVIKAVRNQESQNMKTKNLQMEIMYQLSSSTNINEAIKQFNPNLSTTENISVIAINDNEALKVLKQSIEGVEIHIDITIDEKSPQIETKFCKYYKISKSELLISSLEDAILTRIAIKDYLN